MAAKYVVVLFDYEDRRVVGGYSIDDGGVGRCVVKQTWDGEDCVFDYTALLKINPDLFLLLAEQTNGPPQRLERYEMYHGARPSRSA